MTVAKDAGPVLVTGACGQVGRVVCELLRACGHVVLPTDLSRRSDVVACDLRSPADVEKLFKSSNVHAIIHLAGLLPSAFLNDPLRGADVNLNGSFLLMKNAVSAGVKRFVFASSISVYGMTRNARPATEEDPAVPDDPYGACKRAVEVIGEAVAKTSGLQFVSLRVARVVGPGTKATSASPWRSQILDPDQKGPIQVPFRDGAELSLVHVEDVAQMLVALACTERIGETAYNTPAELWTAAQLKDVVEELRGIPVELDEDGAQGGPTCDGSRMETEFGLRITGLRDRLTSSS